VIRHGGFLSGSAQVAVENAAKIAEAIEAAANAARDDKKFDVRSVGGLSISIGKLDKEAVVNVSSSGWFALRLTTTVDNARKMARALQTAPGIHERLKSSVNFEAMFKGK
jgi:hypothetical protein